MVKICRSRKESSFEVPVADPETDSVARVLVSRCTVHREASVACSPGLGDGHFFRMSSFSSDPECYQPAVFASCLFLRCGRATRSHHGFRTSAELIR